MSITGSGERERESAADDVCGELTTHGAEPPRRACLRAGDVVAVVLRSRKGTAAAVPFQQTVTPQSQLPG
ncbi:hypothetical protein [Streptomyces sp. Root1310]|uniref:hypothetical protein n=1 Tax=Streptomyces sp. Root1310 TaxID=1736452 RepID=UPI000710AA93|nr:hypothetical protein [Streptomyces sp. Root1310]KQX83371.1 hypothetical protein ASD48_09380 [Streptomyces sp. Root1310]